MFAMEIGGQTNREILMFKGVIGLLSLLLIIILSPAHAQDVSGPRISQADFNALTDARIGLVKAALQLTPDQAKYWPAVEDAIRARAQARYARMQAVADQLGSGHDVDPIALFRGRADALAQRAAGLKQLVDAWEPLYRSLAPDQKQRMRIMMARVMPALLSAAVDARRLSDYDETDDDVYVYVPDAAAVGLGPR
jgi:hypothetical protein